MRFKTVTPEGRVLRNYLAKGTNKKGEYVCGSQVREKSVGE